MFFFVFAGVGQRFIGLLNEKNNIPVSVGTNPRLSSHGKTLPTYVVNFLGITKTKSFLYLKKKTLSASVCKRNYAMSAERYKSGPYNERHRSLFILFIPE